MVPASLFVAYKVIPKGKSFFQRVSHVVHMLQMEIPQNSDKHSFGCQVIANMRVSPTDCVMRKSPPFDSPFHPMGGIMSRAAQYSRVRTGSALRHARGCGSATNRTAQESHPIEHGVVLRSPCGRRQFLSQEEDRSVLQRLYCGKPGFYSSQTCSKSSPHCSI